MSQVLSEGFETNITSRGWKSTSPNAATWELDNGSDHGPNSAYAGAKAIMFNVYDYSAGKSGTIESPSFDLSATKNPVIKFYWWCNETGNKISRVVIKTSTDGTVFSELTSFNAEKSGGWKEFSHAVSKEVVKIQIIGVSAYGNKNIFIDELSIGDPANYLFTTSTPHKKIQANTNSEVSFSVSIENKGAENDTYTFTKQSSKSWNWKVYSEENTEISNLLVNAGESKTLKVKTTLPNSGLNHGDEETFNFTITSTGESSKTETINFKVTAIVPLSNNDKSYTFNFESITGEELPVGWTIDNANNNSNQWKADASKKALYFNSNYSSADDWVFSQPFVLDPNVAYRLRYKVKGTSSWNNYKLDAFIGNSVQSIKSSSALEELTQKNDTYVEREVFFTSANTNPTYVAFHAKNYSVYVDDIIIDKAPAYEPKLVSSISSANAIAGEQLEIALTVSNNGGNTDKLNLSSTYKYPVSFKNNEGTTITSLDLNSQQAKNIKVVLDIPANGLINREKLDLVIKATSENQSEKVSQIKVVTTSYSNYSFPFTEKFESNLNNWVFTENTVEQADELSNSKYAHIKAKKNEDYSLILNSFIDLTGTTAPVIEFDHNASIGSYDNFKVQVREFGADYFTKLESEVYTGAPIYGKYGFDRKSLEEWTFSDKNSVLKAENWKHAMFDLSAYKGKRIEIEIIAEYGSYVGKGWLLDNIAVKEAPEYIFVASKVSADPKAYAGKWASHTIEISNKGSKSDIYTLTAEDTSWPVKYYNSENTEITEISIGANSKKSIVVKTQLAADITMGQIESATIKINSKGESSKFEKVSIKTIALKPLTTPYTESFDNNDSKNLEAWQSINANNDNKKWTRQTYYSQSKSYAYNVNNSYTSQPMNDWLITPKVKLESGKKYQVKFHVRGIQTAIEKLALAYAKDLNIPSFESNIVFSKEDINSTTYTKCVAKITPTETADFYLAFKGYSDARTKGIVIDDFSVEEFLNNDLKIKSLSVVNSGFIFENSTVNIKANIENIGANDIVNKKVSLLSNNVEIASTNVSIKSGEAKDLNLSFEATLGLNQKIVCKTSDDDNNTNNTQDLSFDVFQEGYLLEGFEGETFPPKDWATEKINATGNDYIAYKSDGYNSSNNARLKANYSKVSKARLITPELSVKSGDKLEFYAKQNLENTLVVEYTADGATYKNLASITLTNTYKKESIDLSALAGQKVKIAFTVTTKDNYSAFVAIDRVSGPLLAGALQPKMTLNKALGGVAHEFDAFNLGETPQAFDININNEGNAVLELTTDHIQLKGANANEFEMNATFPLNISPGQKFNLVIKPKASSIGTKKANIEIKDPQDAANVKVKQFTVKVNPPKLSITSPLNSATEVALQPQIKWNNISGAYKIDFYVSESTTFTNENKKLDNVNFQSSYQFTENLRYGQRYFCKVVVKSIIDDVEYKTESDVSNFTVLLGDNIVQIGKTQKVETGIFSLPMSCGSAPLSYMTYSQSIYNKSEFKVDTKRIKQVFYYYNGVEKFEQDIVLYMGNTDKENLSGSGYAYVPFDQLEEVYRGKFNVPAVEGWVGIELPVAFDYDPSKNLVVAFDANAKTIANVKAGFYILNGQTGCTRYKTHHSIHGNPDPSDPNLDGLSTNKKPIIRFGLENAPTKPIIYTTTSKIKFEKCAVFQKPERQMQIRNIGAGTLNTSKIEIVGTNASNFKLLSAKSVSIKQGGRANIKIKLLPTKVGKYTASLKITSVDNKVLSIPLSAEAIDTKISKFPFVEDFEDGVFPLPGWYTDKYWMLASSGFQSNHSVTCEFNRVNDAILITPPIALEDNLRLTFRWKNKYTPTGRLGTNDYTYVEITEDNGKTWKELGNYTINFESFDYQLQKINLSAYANKTVKIRFRHSITPGANRKTAAITLDDITIEKIPYTPSVTDFNLTVEGNNNIRINWKAPKLDPTKPSNPIKGYLLFRNGKQINKDPITANTYLDQNLKRGEYEYVLIAVYEKGFSNRSMPDVILLDIEEAYPIKNLGAEVLKDGDKKNVKLSWEKPVKKKTIKVYPSDDTYGPAKTGKYSKSQIWVANYKPKGHHEVGMFKFDVSELDANKIEKVTLRMNQIFMAKDYNTEPSKVYAISEDWNETDFDYSTKPKYDNSQVWAEYSFGGNGWQEIDITDLVKAWVNKTIPNNGLCLVAADGDRLRVFDSKESFVTANRPHISVVTEDNSSDVNPNHGKGIGYKVYRNNEEIAEVKSFETTEYTDQNLQPNFYAYSVSAVYSKAGESEKSDPKIVNVSINDESAWTWMIYLYEDKTGLDGAEDINELEVLGSIPGMINYIVLYDSDDDEKDGVYYITKDPQGENNKIVSKKISDQFGKDPKMSDWNLLSKFMKWSADEFPARNYALTMWDHGNGIFRSGSETVRSFVGNMNLWEMDRALKEFTNKTKKKLEIVGFDLCLLGQAETVYQLKDFTNYVIASEKTEPGDGWDYVTQFKALNDNPLIDPAVLSKHMVEEYVKSYSIGGNSNVAAVTQAATDTKVFDQEMIPALNELAGKLIDHLYEHKGEIDRIRDLAWNSSQNVDHKDLGHFAKLIANSNKLPEDLKKSAKKFIEKYNKAIVATGYTQKANEETTGLRIWIPKSVTGETENSKLYLDPVNYLKISETLWDEFIFNYENPQQNPKRLNVEKTQYEVNAAATNLSIQVNKIGDGDVYWNIDHEANWFTINSSQLINSNTIEISMKANTGKQRKGYVNITSEGVIGCPIRIAVVQKTAFASVETISAIANQQNVNLSWTMPSVTVNPTAILVYRDSKLIATITDMNQLKYIDENVEVGSHSYHLILQYGTEKSIQSSNAVIDVKKAIKINSFSAEKKQASIDLSWNVSNLDASFVKYNIYLNDKLIKSITDASVSEFIYETSENGDYKFILEIVYNKDKTLRSDVKGIKINHPIIQGFSVKENEQSVGLSWNVSNLNASFVKYNIYLNDELIKSITDASISEFIYNNIKNGTCKFCLEIVYDINKTMRSKVQVIDINKQITGIDDLENLKISIYPNPVIDFVYIKTNGSKIESINLINLTGRVVYSNQNVNNYLNKISMNNLPNGMYFLRIKTKSGFKTYKVIK